MNHNVINNAIALLKSFEGCSLKPYKDFAGNYTIGYGHKRLPSELVCPISQTQADDLLRTDFMYFVTYLSNKLPNLFECELCALACFSFNVGLSWFKPTTNLGREVLAYNSRHFNIDIRRNVMYWMKQYCKSKNTSGHMVVLPGLVRRRSAEADFFNGNINFVKQTMY